MQKQKTIVLICSGLNTPGGIERATVNLANLLSSNGVPLTLLVLDKRFDSFYEINPNVRMSYCNLHFGITSEGNTIKRKIQFLKHIYKLNTILEELNPDIIISTDYSFTIATYLAFANKAILYSWEHHHFYWIKKNRFWKTLHDWVYKKLDAVICLNQTEARLFNRIGCSTVVIPNFVIQQNNPSVLQNKTLLTIGWLIKRKGIDLIPQIAEKIANRYPDWKWKIIGQGELYHELALSIKKEKLDSFIELIIPSSPDLSNVYKNTSLHIMTSRFECFPMVLLEAKSYGIPSIAFNCPTGPADIIQDRIDGMLIEPENVDAIAQAICYLISNVEKRVEMGKNALKNSKQFSPEQIFQLWQRLFDSPTPQQK